MGIEPPNPYAPSAALAADDDRKGTPGSSPKRWLAIVGSLACFQLLPGAGFIVLGRARRFAVWAAGGVVAYALMVAAAWFGQPRLFLFAVVAVVALDFVHATPVRFAPQGRR